MMLSALQKGMFVQSFFTCYFTKLRITIGSHRRGLEYASALKIQNQCLAGM
eukprot:c4571_g1_i1 orf=127-279(-)